MITTDDIGVSMVHTIGAFAFMFGLAIIWALGQYALRQHYRQIQQSIRRRREVARIRALWAKRETQL